MSRITIKDLARYTGLSISTVSKALSDSYSDISEETRKRVREAAKQYNYSANKLASAMVSKRSFNICLLLPNIRNPFFAEVTRGVEDYAYEKGYNTILCSSDDNVSKENRYLASLTKGMVDGIIITPSEFREEGFDNIVPDDVPIVMLGGSILMNRCHTTVRTDSVKGAFDAVEYIINMGHTDILFIGGQKQSPITKLRLEGYLMALQKYNIPVKENLIYRQFMRSEWGEETIHSALASGDKFTAVFCDNDLIAYGVLKGLKHAGLKVPDDISVVGFDDLPILSEYIGLTSVCQPKYELGRRSAQTLLDQLEGKEVEDQFLEAKLMKRETVCFLKNTDNLTKQGGKP